MNLAGTIRKFRQEKGLTQAELARLLNISPTAVNKWERGTNSPDISNLLPMSRILDVSVDDLLKYGSVCTPKQLRTYIMEVFHLLEQKSFSEAFRVATIYLEDYPNDLALQSNLLSMLLTSQNEKQKSEQEEITKRMHRLVINNLNSLSDSFIDVLMQYYLSVEDYLHAEELLELLPKQASLYSRLKADFYRSKGDYSLAYKTYEEILYGSQMMINNVLISLTHMAEYEGNKDMASYYINKRVAVMEVFEIGKFAQLGALLHISESNQMSYHPIMNLLYAVPTIDSFVRSKLYSHMTFDVDETGFLAQQIYKDFLADLTDKKENFDLSDEERDKVIQYIEMELNSLDSGKNRI